MIPRKLLDEIELWIKQGKFGHLQINFNGGKIVNVNRVESVKVTQLGDNFVAQSTLTAITDIKV